MRKNPSTSRALTPIQTPKGGALAPVAPPKPAAAALAGFISENTKRAYERDLKDFFRTEDLSTLKVQEIIAVQPGDVVTFRDRLIADGFKPSTICRKLSAIRSMYDHLRASGTVERNPADPKLVRSPRRGSIRKTSPLSASELIRLLAAPDRKTENGLRDHAMLLLASQAGLRREELCAMKDDQLSKHGDRWCVMFRGKGGKERRIPLHGSVVEAIRAWQRVRVKEATATFCKNDGSSLSPDSFYKTVIQYAAAAGFTAAEKRVHPHSLRAAFATILHRQGMPLKEIKDLMGHSRIETTAGYVEEADLMESKAPDMLADALKAAGPQDAP